MYKLFWMLALTFSIGQVQAQEIQGQVLDSLTKQGIPLSVVVLTDYNLGTQCDSSGRFQFTGSFPEKVSIKVSSYGYETRFFEARLGEKLIISLFSQHLELDEVTVSGARNLLQRDNSVRVEHSSISELNVVPVTNLGQAIEAIPGVYNASTGNGISKPVIRGLQGSRVLTLLNGIRIENQQWGGDHGMGLTDLGIESVEVIKGPASLLYGADALGGVIYFFDESYAPQKTHILKISSQFEHNSMGSVSSLFYRGSIKGLRINGGGRFNTQADYQLPNGQYVKNSRFRDMAGKVSLGWSRGKWISNLKYSYASARVGLSGHTHDSIIVPELFISSDQLRSKTLPVQYFTNHIASFDNKFIFKKHTLDLLVGFTQNALEEFEEKVTIPALELNLQNVLYNFKVNSEIGKRFTAVYGIQGMFQNMVNGSKASERLLPNSLQYDNGIYTNFYYDLQKWKFQAGVRADLRTLSSESDSIDFPVSFRKTFSGFNFAFGTVYSAKRQLVRINISSGFRVPHMSELLSDGVHHGTLRYEVGDVNLVPEKAIQIDLTYEVSGDHLSFVLNPFVSQIKDYIGLNPQDSIVEGLPLFNYEQLDQAQLYGADFGFHYHPHFAHVLHIESSFSYLRGTSGSSQNLSLMPQARISSSAIVRLNMKTKFRISEIVLQHQYFLPQNDVVSYETRSVDYSVFNVGMNMKSMGNQVVEIQVGARNFTNTKYINHLSRLKNIGLESPGLKLYLKLSLTLNYHEKK